MDLTEFISKHGKQWEGFFAPSDMGRDFFSMLESLSPKPESDKSGDANVALQFVARYDQHRKLIDNIKTIKSPTAMGEPLTTTFLGEPPAELNKPEEKTNV